MTPSPPVVEQVAAGIWSIPVPLPIRELPHVLVYALETPRGLVLVDAGWDTPQAWEALVAGLGRLGADPADVIGVLATHVHPDHYGLCRRVRETSDAWIALHPADAAMLDPSDQAAETLASDTVAWGREVGLPASDLDAIGPQVAAMRTLLGGLGAPDVLLDHHDRIPGLSLRAVHTPGHSPGHLCFHDPDRQILFTGDHVLPRITPNVAHHPLSSADPLGDYLASLATVAALPTDLVLPAHEWRFHGLRDRVRQLQDHHEARLGHVLDAVADGAATTYEVAAAMAWDRPWDQLPALPRQIAVGEIHAHLLLLQRNGTVDHMPGPPAHWRRPAR